MSGVGREGFETIEGDDIGAVDTAELSHGQDLLQLLERETDGIGFTGSDDMGVVALRLDINNIRQPDPGVETGLADEEMGLYEGHRFYFLVVSLFSVMPLA